MPKNLTREESFNKKDESKCYATNESLDPVHDCLSDRL